MTTADFVVASIVFTYIYNSALAGGEVFWKQGQAIVDEHKCFAAYVGRLKTEFATYL